MVSPPRLEQRETLGPVPSAPIVILTGPTAAGKSQLAADLAAEHGQIEIVNADSILVYRGFNIGSAKPDATERRGVPHHLIDVRDPSEAFTAGDFVRDCERLLSEIATRGKRVLIVGGTGFYLKALLFGLWEVAKADPELRKRVEARTTRELYDQLYAVDQEAALRISLGDRYRLVRAVEIWESTGKTPSSLEAEAERRGPDPRYQIWLVDRPAAELKNRIRTRTRQMLQNGFIEEVRSLSQNFPGARSLGAVGYAQVLEHLAGRTPAGRKVQPGLPGLEDEIVLATQQLIKRQRTWFRSQTQARRYELPADEARLREDFWKVYK
ncbi:MAG: tRNA (adenosine(37)-N6)-dimethylallyltransferase MiaA [Bacteriovoracia bacterium]